MCLVKLQYVSSDTRLSVFTNDKINSIIKSKECISQSIYCRPLHGTGSMSWAQGNNKRLKNRKSGAYAVLHHKRRMILEVMEVLVFTLMVVKIEACCTYGGGEGTASIDMVGMKYQ